MRYILLQDTPELRAGAILKHIDETDPYYEETPDSYVTVNEEEFGITQKTRDSVTYYFDDVVETQPLWFRELPPE